MRSLAALLLFVSILCVSGCRGGTAKAADTNNPVAPDAGKSLAGQWEGTDPKDHTRSAFWLAEDGTFIMFAANDFAGGGFGGKWKQTADELQLGPGELANKVISPPMSYKYKWTSGDEVELSLAIDPQNKFRLKRTGAAPKTANIDALTNNPKMQAQTDSVTCMSNLKQLALGQMMYAQDWDQTLPPSYSWGDATMPYLKDQKIFTCPTLAKSGQQSGYAMDSTVSGARMEKISAPVSTVILFESTSTNWNASDPQASVLHVPRHGDGINFAYADGHVKAVR